MQYVCMWQICCANPCMEAPITWGSYGQLLTLKDEFKSTYIKELNSDTNKSLCLIIVLPWILDRIVNYALTQGCIMESLLIWLQLYIQQASVFVPDWTTNSIIRIVTGYKYAHPWQAICETWEANIIVPHTHLMMSGTMCQTWLFFIISSSTTWK